jgi:hypothetical protein
VRANGSLGLVGSLTTIESFFCPISVSQTIGSGPGNIGVIVTQVNRVLDFQKKIFTHFDSTQQGGFIDVWNSGQQPAGELQAIAARNSSHLVTILYCTVTVIIDLCVHVFAVMQGDVIIGLNATDVSKVLQILKSRTYSTV